MWVIYLTKIVKDLQSINMIDDDWKMDSFFSTMASCKAS